MEGEASDTAAAAAAAAAAPPTTTTTTKRVENDLKMYLLVRTDLGMRPGKACAQCAHAAIGAYKTAFAHGHAEMLRRWERQGATIVNLRVAGEDQMWRYHDLLASKTTTHVVTDRNVTHRERDCVTVIAIGPTDVNVASPILKKLKLY